MVAAGVMLVVVLAAAPAADPELDTREFTGEGSVGTGSQLELYLPPGEYRHELVSDCDVAASLFPAERLPQVRLGDVLQADLATATDRQEDRGDLAIGVGGWANLQVGTGPECRWVYRITGAFVALGEEPPPPRAVDDVGGPWGIGVVALLVVVVLLAVRRSRGAANAAGDPDEEPTVRIGPG